MGLVGGEGGGGGGGGGLVDVKRDKPRDSPHSLTLLDLTLPLLQRTCIYRTLQTSCFLCKAIII